MSNGEISGNTATNSGGGVWVHVDQIDQLFVSNGMVFSNNRASTSWNRNSEHDAVYAKQIGSSITWTTPFTQGYNNYDIGYTNNIKPNITPDSTPGPIGTRTPSLFTVEPSTPVLSDKGDGMNPCIGAIVGTAVAAVLVVVFLFLCLKKRGKTEDKQENLGRFLSQNQQ
jgi:hypothetical protein